ncbi:MAG: metal-dependent transcriptional regulator [Desulfarculaceae bacterium]|jgi:DtxR family Mn-dependent transcriptional regulator
MVHEDPKGQDYETLTSQSEDYLEVIAQLQKEDRVARAKDIADRLGVTRGTVTSALRGLNEKGLINYQPYSHITLTEAGEKLAAEIIHRHEILTKFFHEVLQMPPTDAEANACRAEHVLDPKIIEQMVCFLEFLNRCPRTSQIWRQSFGQFCISSEGKSNCKECVGRCLAELYEEDS